MEQHELFRHVIGVLERLGITYMVVGSFASGAWGEPRMTQDIDIVIAPEPGQLEALCAAFDSEEFYVSREAARDALRRRAQFNIIHPGSGNKIDFMVARQDAWGQVQLSRRARVWLLPDQEGFSARPEDIILGKLIYYAEGGSEKHLRDITGILKLRSAQVDLDYIRRWAEELGVSEIWNLVRQRGDDPR